MKQQTNKIRIFKYFKLFEVTLNIYTGLQEIITTNGYSIAIRKDYSLVNFNDIDNVDLIIEAYGEANDYL